MSSLKPGVTVSPPGIALSSLTVKVRESPSTVLASAIVTVALSSSVMAPAAVSVAVTPDGASDTLRVTVKVSLPSTASSSMVETVNVCSSPAVPVKLRAAVFAV